MNPHVPKLYFSNLTFWTVKSFMIVDQDFVRKSSQRVQHRNADARVQPSLGNR